MINWNTQEAALLVALQRGIPITEASFAELAAATGICADCNSPERICRITTILDRRPRFTETHVLVVNEDMGL